MRYRFGDIIDYYELCETLEQKKDFLEELENIVYDLKIEMRDMNREEND